MRPAVLLLSSVIVGTCLVHVPRAEAGSHEHARNGWMVGFGLGGGSADVDLEGYGNADREGGGTGNIRVGYAVKPSLVLGIELTGWTKDMELGTQNGRWTFSTATFAATFYQPGSGFFLRGGLGTGSASVETEVPGGTLTNDDTGWGLLFATGYEWRLTRRFALGPQLEFSYQKETDNLSSNIFSGTLGFNWYW